MATTTNPNFHADTTGYEVTAAFKDRVVGKTALITGVNKGGIGFSTAQALASQSPKQIIITGRNAEKLKISADALRAEFPNVKIRLLLVDQSKQSSIRKAAEEVLSWTDVPKIDYIFNSAGVMGVSERTITEDGIELHLATNVVGHWLLTNLLLPKLIAASKDSEKGATRIINVSALSPIFSTMRWSDMNFEKKNKDLPESEQPTTEFMEMWSYKDIPNQTYIPFDGYCRSKTGNILFGIAANKRLFERYGIFSTGLHPGIITTELGRQFPPQILAALRPKFEDGTFSRKSFEAGSSTSLVAALDPKLAQGVGQEKDGSENWGAFLKDCQVDGSCCPLAVSSSEAEKLWEWCETVTGQKFS